MYTNTKNAEYAQLEGKVILHPYFLIIPTFLKSVVINGVSDSTSDDFCDALTLDNVCSNNILYTAAFKRELLYALLH